MRYRGIHQRRVRTASGSDWILRAAQHKHLFRKLLLIRSLPLAVLTRLVALTFSYTQWQAPSAANWTMHKQYMIIPKLHEEL